MIKINKSSDENELTLFLHDNPNATWVEFRNDASGVNYKAIKTKLFNEQFDLCAYCEASVSLSKVTENNRRVEHFISKSANHLVDRNIILDWFNLLGVCLGGSDIESKNSYELPANLSCDSHKEHVEGSIGRDWSGSVLFPTQMANGSDFFKFEKSTGKLVPNTEYCNAVNIIGNNHQNTEQLVIETIRVFNLNCDRLNAARLKILHQFDKQLKALRISKDRDKLAAFVKFWQSQPNKSYQTTRNILLKGNRVTASLLA